MKPPDALGSHWQFSSEATAIHPRGTPICYAWLALGNCCGGILPHAPLLPEIVQGLGQEIQHLRKTSPVEKRKIMCTDSRFLSGEFEVIREPRK
jgi:hypothetical protein